MGIRRRRALTRARPQPKRRICETVLYPVLYRAPDRISRLEPEGSRQSREEAAMPATVTVVPDRGRLIVLEDWS